MRSARASTGAASSVHVLIARHAAARPDSLAIVGSERLTYRQLAEAIAEVAAGLQARGVGPGDRVGIVGETSTASLIAMLAAGRAGAAYVPVRHSDPISRVLAMAKDAGIELFIGTSDDAPTGLAVVSLEALRAARGGTLLPSDTHGENEAYVLYTSGSTGRPKGVAIWSSSLTNYLGWVSRANRLGSKVPIIPALTSFSFDASVQQLLAPLWRGDPVWMVPPGTASDPELVAEVLARHEGPGLHCVPSLWAEVFD